MSEFCNRPTDLMRPRLLIRAARHGLDEYRRDRDLRRLLGGNAVPAPFDAVPRLASEEARLEGIRVTGDVAYSIARHIEVLIALMAEARMLPRNMGA